MRPCLPQHSPRCGHGARPTVLAAAGKKDVASTIMADTLAQVAALALRTRLRKCDDVAVIVDCTAQGLLSGKVQGVDMVGKGWESLQGLKARLLSAQVGRVSIDAGALLTQRCITLVTPPLGTARAVFSADDFGAFLTHPLMAQAAAMAVKGHPFHFEPEAVELLPATPHTSPSGAAAAQSPGHHQQHGGQVVFMGSCRGTRYQVHLASHTPATAPSQPATAAHSRSQRPATAHSHPATAAHTHNSKGPARSSQATATAGHQGPSKGASTPAGRHNVVKVTARAVGTAGTSTADMRSNTRPGPPDHQPHAHAGQGAHVGPGAHASQGAHAGQGARGSHASQSPHVAQGGSHPTQGSHASQALGQGAHASQQGPQQAGQGSHATQGPHAIQGSHTSQQASQHTDDDNVDVEVSAALTTLFQHLFIDLYGVEMRFASLRVLPPHCPTAYPVAPHPQPLIDLGLSLRVRQFPPLNVQF